MDGEALQRLQGLQHSIIDNIQQTEAMQLLSEANSRRLSLLVDGGRRREELQLTVDLHNQLLLEEELLEGVRSCEREASQLRARTDLLRADCAASGGRSAALGATKRASLRRLEAAWEGLRQLLEPIKESFLMLREERLSLLSINSSRQWRTAPTAIDAAASVRVAVERSEAVQSARRRLRALQLRKNDLMGEVDAM